MTYTTYTTRRDVTVTVVVPTYRRPEGLRRVLAGLARQRDPGVAWDVVVVDNDGHAVLPLTFPSSPAVRMVVELRTGAAHARNRGLAEARGRWVAFLDDDVEPADDWLARLTAPVFAGSCDGTAGRVVLDPSVPRPGWWHEGWMGLYLAAYAPFETETPVPRAHYILTANACLERTAVLANGGFDPALGPRRGVPIVNDDMQVFRDYVDSGRVVHYVPDAVVVHELPASRLLRRYLLARLHAQGRSDWLLERSTMTPGAGVRLAGTLARAALVSQGPPTRWRRESLYFLAGAAARSAGVLRETVVGLRRGAGRGVADEGIAGDERA